VHLGAVQGAISSDGFVSSLQVIEWLYKNTDNTGVSDEIGGVECMLLIESARGDAKDSIQTLLTLV
jgi:hypothetical protein